MEQLKKYLQKVKNESFASLAPTEIDYLIFAWLSYTNFEAVFKPFYLKKITLSNAAKIISSSQVKENKKTKIHANSPTEAVVNAKRLLLYLANLKRYQNIFLTSFSSKFDKKIKTQFAACAFLLSETSEVVVSFRGTTNDLTGWEEDCNLSFKKSVPAQTMAKNFLLKSIFRFPFHKFNIVGHSKGGNLAMYSVIPLPQILINKVATIYNFDGPGFNSKIKASKNYSKMISITKTIIPHDSIVGLILKSDGKIEYIQSNGSGVIQHNAFLWKIKGNQFLRSDEHSKSSSRFIAIIMRWLESVDDSDKELLFTHVFKSLEENNITTMEELTSHPLRATKILIKAAANLPKEKQDRLKKTIAKIPAAFLNR